MDKSKKLLKLLSTFVENGILSSQDIKNELLTNLKFRKDNMLDKLDLVSREEYEILKKIVQKHEKEIKKLTKVKKAKKS